MSADRNVFSYGVIPPAPSMTIAEVARLFASSSQNVFADDFDRYRRRRDWNDRFEHWERPASTTEETTLDRGQRMVPWALSG